MTSAFPLALVAAAALAGAARADGLPEGVVDTQDPADIPLTPLESLERIQVPEGFRTTLFAGEPDVRRPIAFDFDDRGRLWVVENYSHPVWKEGEGKDRILILEDIDHDGRFDRRKVFWDRGRYLTGIAWGDGGVWIANTPSLEFLPDRNQDDVPDSPPQARLDGFRISSNNVVNNLHWGPDGWLYGAIGIASPSLVGVPGSPEQERRRITRGIWRYHPRDRTFEVVARGMVNPWGADFNQWGDLFTANTTTAHLFHILPGMYCQRREREPVDPHVYQTVQSIADHLHWGGGAWHDSRGGSGIHSVAGGGHAHCGAMVYLGDNWPERYRGAFFTANLHGNRINMERLLPRASGYVAEHGDDFLMCNDPWFRALSLKYGPDGGVFVSDWHDLGECHDNDGSHRSSGRIFKVVHQDPGGETFDLAEASSLELARLQLHPNEWHSRHARRLLGERARAGEEAGEALDFLREQLRGGAATELRLRSLWTLYAMEALDEDRLAAGLADPDLHIRRWSVRLLVDRGPCSPAREAELAALAASEPEAKVRLALAVALQRMRTGSRWALAEGLAGHGGDAADPVLPRMLWYGLRSFVHQDPIRALALARRSALPQIREWTARMMLELSADHLPRILEMLPPEAPVLAGVLGALEPLGSHPAPPGWAALEPSLDRHPDPRVRSLSLRLAMLFGDEGRIAEQRRRVAGDSLPSEARKEALETLSRIDGGLAPALLHQLVERPSPLRESALQALLRVQDPGTGSLILSRYASMETRERQAALAVLASRVDFARQMLEAVRAGDIPRPEIPAAIVRQLRSIGDPSLSEAMERIGFGEGAAQAGALDRWRLAITPESLARGNPGRGRVLFDQLCAGCHRLHGEGSTLGPDLTGSGRRDLDYLLANLADPSALVDPSYRMTTASLEDGRVFHGFVESLGDRHLVLATQQGSFRFSMQEVRSIETSELSMMPEGILDALPVGHARDLLRYLTLPGQVPYPADPGGAGSGSPPDPPPSPAPGG